MFKRSLTIGSSILGVVILLLVIGRGVVAVSAERGEVLAGGTIVSSDIMTDTVWTLAGSPYLLDGNIQLDMGVTLTVEPGVTVQGDDPFEYVTIRGNLVAIGLPGNPITFTSLTESGPGEWANLILLEGTVDLQHVTLKHGHTGLSVWGPGQANLSDVQIENNTYGIETATPFLHNLAMSNVVFSNNDFNRVLIGSFGGDDELLDNVTLTAQPGLEGYEVGSSGFGELIVPAGISLTLSAGTTMMFDEQIVRVLGHLEANGTTADPVTFRSVSATGTGEWWGIEVSGSARLQGASVQNAIAGLWVWPTNGGVYLEDVLLQQNLYGIETGAETIHLLNMVDVTFMNNDANRVRIYVPDGADSLVANTTLTDQQGLEGYEVSSSSHIYFVVPAGITLTLEAGTTLLVDDMFVRVHGHLDAQGEDTNPITLRSVSATGTEEWRGLEVAEGSIHLQHTVIQNGLYGILTWLAIDKDILLENVLLTENSIPIDMPAGAIHHLNMTDVTFANNEYNRVRIHAPDDEADALVADTTLTDQEGLEGYEVYAYSHLFFRVPAGITLTLEPGVTLLMDYRYVMIEGHLEAVGTPTNSITFRSTTSTAPNEWHSIVMDGGSAHLNHVTLSHAAVGVSLYEVPTSGEILLENVTIENNLGGIETGITELHALNMNNVTFVNNEANQVFIYASADVNTLVADTVLTAQPGLEGYILANEYGGDLVIPAGVSLTLSADTTLFVEDNFIQVQGHLALQGTESEEATITLIDDGESDPWGGIRVMGSLESSYGSISGATVALWLTEAEGVVQLTNTTIENNSFAMDIFPSNLHLLQMDNVSFIDNGVNRVHIYSSYGALTEDVTLTPQPGLEAYELLSSDGSLLQVPAGTTLSLQPGTTLMSIDSGLAVEGHLEAVGTPTQPITLTSDGDDNALSWLGLTMQGGSANLAHLLLRYAQDGVLVDGGLIEAQCVSLVDNVNRGVWVSPAGNPTISIIGSTLTGNGLAGIVNEHPNLVLAQNNWWGDASGPSGDGAGSGDAIFGNVLYEPWLMEPECVTNVIFEQFLPIIVSP